MNKKIAMSGVSIMAALAIMGGATYAAFTSEASNNGNTFGSGNMTLKINGSAGSASTPVFGVSGAVPGSVYSQKLTLLNEGDATASSVLVSSINVGGTNPDLANKLTVKFFNDANDDGVFNGGDTDLGTAHLNDPVWNNYVLPSVSIPAGGTFNLAAQLTFDLDADNTYKNKSAAFNFNLQAAQ